MRNTEPEYLQYLFLKARAGKVPLSGTFEITGRCNFNCRMCYIHSSDNAKLKEKELSTEQWLSIADSAQKAGTLMLLITGGEPLLRDDFAEIYTYCKKLGFEININTNASLVDDKIIKLFRDYSPARISVTLYGANEETYRNTTCREGYYQVVTENIKRMKAAGLPVKMNLTASNYNSADIPLIFKFAEENGMPVESACYLFPSARLGRNTDRPSALDAARNELLCERFKNTPERFAQKARAAKNIVETERTIPAIGEKIRCRAGSAAYWITYEGKMLPCGMMETPVASVTENGFDKAWQIINTESQKIFLPPECSGCDYSEVCFSCAASCYAETGRFDGVPEYVCEKTKEYVRLFREECKE